MKNYICIDGKKIAISCETAKNLKAEFSKEEPPAIRHGEWRISKTGDAQFYIKDHTGAMRLCESDHLYDGSMNTWSIIKDKDVAVSGNLVDDLKMYVEDLEGFEVSTHHGGTLRATIDDTSDIAFFLRVNYATANIKEAQEIHQKLGQLIAYARRQAKKKDC